MESRRAGSPRIWETWCGYYFSQNHEGSVTLLTDGNGSVIERYRYDAFGAPTIYTGTWGARSNTIYDTRFLFTGREYAATYRSTYTTPVFNFYSFIGTANFHMAQTTLSGSRQSGTWAGGSLQAYGLDRGWSSEDAAVTAAVDGNLRPHLYGTGDNTEIGGGTFPNKNGTWGYSVIHSDRNTAATSVVIGVPPDRTQHRSWHIHTGQPHTHVNEFSRADRSQPYGIYLGTPNRMIQLYDRSLTPHVQVIRPALLPDY